MLSGPDDGARGEFVFGSRPAVNGLQRECENATRRNEAGGIVNGKVAEAGIY